MIKDLDAVLEEVMNDIDEMKLSIAKEFLQTIADSITTNNPVALEEHILDIRTCDKAKVIIEDFIRRRA